MAVFGRTNPKGAFDVVQDDDPNQRRFSIRADSSAMFFGENVRVEIGNPLLAFLRDPQIAQSVANVGLDGLPEKGGIRGAEVLGSLKSELLARAGLWDFGKERRCL